MTAQDLIDAAELHRVEGKFWMAQPIWEQVTKEFPESVESAYAKAPLEKHVSKRSGVISQAWRGQRPLGEIFWIYYVFVPGGLRFIFWLLSLLEPSRTIGLISLVLYSIILVLVIPYSIWVYFSLWRCSVNASAGFRFIVRGLVIFTAWLPMAVIAYSLIFR